MIQYAKTDLISNTYYTIIRNLPKFPQNLK